MIKTKIQKFILFFSLTVPLSPLPKGQGKRGYTAFFMFLLISGMCLCGSISWLNADETVSLQYTYREETTQVPLLKDIKGNAYLPLMEVAKFYGVQVEYDSTSRRVFLGKGKNRLKVVVSQPVFLTMEPSASYPMDPVEVVAGQLGIPPESSVDLLQALLNINARYVPDQKALLVGGVKDEELRREIMEQVKQLRPPSAPAGEAAAKPEPTPTEEAEVAVVRPRRGRVEQEEPDPRKIYKVRKVVIDAGHGGKDAGAWGYARRLKEKDITLDIAQRVDRLLGREKSLKVFMTRNSDHYITLKYRTDVANAQNADLFVSIHCNANPRSKVTGTETYFYSSHSSNKVAQVAAVRENGGEDLMNTILTDLRHSAYRIRSYRLAEQVEGRIRDRLGLPIRRVQKGPFYVLACVNMPSILIETAYISNREEEEKLSNPAWRDKIAHAITDGILAYKGIVEESVENLEARR
jgi:N-acetylmuramoyl-L-alanine amidase